MTGKQNIEWFYTNLFSYRKGTLSDGDRERFGHMLETSSECRDAFEAADVLERVEHDTADLIPTSVLAQWKEIVPKLDPTERELVVRHLKRSEETMRDLDRIGVTEPLAGLGGDSGEAMDPGADAVRGFEQQVRAATEHVLPRFRRWVWGLGLYGAAATAAIVFFLLRPPSVEPPSGLQGLSAPLQILRTTRGGETQTISIEKNAPYLMLSPSGPTLSADNRRLRIRLFDPTNNVIHTSEARLSTGNEPRRITVLIPASGEWLPGSYKLSVEDPVSGQVLSDYVFELEVE